MRNYFERYSGGMKDVQETFDIFNETMEKFVIPEIALPELEGIHNLFSVRPYFFRDSVMNALFESEDSDEINQVEERLRKLRDDLRVLAEARGITLVLGQNGLAEAAQANKNKNPLEYRVFNILHVCVEKLAALLTYKRTQIELSRKKLT